MKKYKLTIDVENIDELLLSLYLIGRDILDTEDDGSDIGNTFKGNTYFFEEVEK